MALQLLALLYIVLALRSMLKMEAAADDPLCMNFYKLSQQCLVSGKFLVNNSLTTVQTLSLMAKFTAYAGLQDVEWQIRGMATRIMLAMGLHRDGQGWNLSVKDLNNRRRTFWDAYSTDVLISSNWDRPSGLHADLFDTQMPDDHNLGTGFERQRCRMSVLAQEALQESLKIMSNYKKLREIWHKILEVKSETPFHLRNRAALTLMASEYPTLAEVEANTPPPSKNLRLVFQSHDLIHRFHPHSIHVTATRCTRYTGTRSMPIPIRRGISRHNRAEQHAHCQPEISSLYVPSHIDSTLVPLESRIFQRSQFGDHLHSQSRQSFCRQSA